MPGETGVHVVKKAVAGHKSLGAAVFLARAAVIADRAGDVVLRHVFFDDGSGGQGGGAQAVVAAAVAISPGNQLVVNRAGGLLAQAGQGVELAQKSDHGLARAIGGDKGGGDACDAGFHRKALILGHFLQILGGFVLFHARFGKLPYLIADLVEQLLFGLYGLADKFFLIHSFIPPVLILDGLSLCADL